MKYFSHVAQVEVLPDYVLLVTFRDGVRKLYDMKPQLYGAFEVLKEVSFFNRATALHGCVVWSDLLDIAPEELYFNGVPVQ